MSYTIRVQYGYAQRRGVPFAIATDYVAVRVNTDTLLVKGESAAYGVRRYREICRAHTPRDNVRVSETVDHITGHRTHTAYYRNTDGLLDFVRVVLA